MTSTTAPAGAVNVLPKAMSALVKALQSATAGCATVVSHVIDAPMRRVSTGKIPRLERTRSATLANVALAHSRRCYSPVPQRRKLRARLRDET